MNDNHGYVAGDRLIKVLAEIMHAYLRASDVIAHYGGDEFVVLLPETDGEHARDAGERICSAVEHTSFDMDGKRLTSTVSVGASAYPQDAIDANELMEMADAALYQSKGTGRNCVTIYSDEKTKK